MMPCTPRRPRSPCLRATAACRKTFASGNIPRAGRIWAEYPVSRTAAAHAGQLPVAAARRPKYNPAEKQAVKKVSVSTIGS